VHKSSYSWENTLKSIHSISSADLRTLQPIPEHYQKSFHESPVNPTATADFRGFVMDFVGFYSPTLTPDLTDTTKHAIMVM